VQLRVVSGEPLRCSGYRVQLEVALFCLLENAVDALAGGGTVTVTVEKNEDGAAGEGRNGLLAVDDDGPGLGAAERPLEPFFSTRKGRLGLGLNVARTVAARHGGTVEIGPAPGGRGVRATIRVAMEPEA
jgi:signal transduction histidine kinase